MNHICMEEFMEERVLELKAEILKALAQPTRMKILECLRDGEKCICEIVPAIHGEQSNISRHISLMQKTHLVSTRKEGVRVMVKVSDPNVFEILDSIGLLLKKQIMETGKLAQQLK
ncbi:MAG: ArsR family transcriptional regulator [Deltaproteobacteria bacterium CG_4_8_14_3_um_filter_45_9]|nr:MAG: ArsR family transcriptional regulator [Deltaproteobacteria bacterium CG03_land_8_20_14_0_80_45_14]PIX21583.1 MAG: ArsR family transcriptional regulator [Deltaproteobacteria bacterium CG_4_8_14_3_um_filter_45_9]